MKLKGRYKPALGWLIFITILLCIPGSEFPRVTWLSEIWFDKWVHIGMFMILVFLMCMGYKFRNTQKEQFRKQFLGITVLCILYGVLMELVQHYLVPFRSFELADILADGAGSVFGLILAGKKWIKKSPADRG